MKIILYALLSLTLLSNIVLAGGKVHTWVSATQNYDIQNHINMHRALYNMGKEFHITPDVFTDSIEFFSSAENHAKEQLYDTDQSGFYTIDNITYVAINARLDDLYEYLYDTPESPVYNYQYTNFACAAKEDRAVCAFTNTGGRNKDHYTWDRNKKRMHLPVVKVGDQDDQWYRVVLIETDQEDTLKLEGYAKLHPDEVCCRIYHATYKNGMLYIPRLRYTEVADDRWLTKTTSYKTYFNEEEELIFELDKMLEPDFNSIHFSGDLYPQ